MEFHYPTFHCTFRQCHVPYTQNHPRFLVLYYERFLYDWSDPTFRDASGSQSSHSFLVFDGDSLSDFSAYTPTVSLSIHSEWWGLLFSMHVFHMTHQIWLFEMMYAGSPDMACCYWLEFHYLTFHCIHLRMGIYSCRLGRQGIHHTIYWIIYWIYIGLYISPTWNLPIVLLHWITML